MKEKVFVLKQKLATPAHSLYLAVQKAFNACNQALTQAQAAESSTLADPLNQVKQVDQEAALAPDAVARLQRQLVSIKYDAQLAEKDVVNMGETLTYRQSDFANEAAFLSRRQHALDGELFAIEAQLICARLLADMAVRQGLERPEGEISFLRQKMQRKEAEAAALQTRIAA